MKEIKKQLSLRWDELMFVFAVVIFTFILGMGINVFAIHVFHEGGIPGLATIMAAVIFAIVALFSGISTLCQCFNLSVGMCMARKRFIFSFLSASFAMNIVMSGILRLLNQLESLIADKLQFPIEETVDISFLLMPQYILMIALLLVAFQAIFGALLQKYGKVVFWIIWGLWIVVCIGGSRLADTELPFMEAVWKFYGMLFENTLSTFLTICGFSLIILSIAYELLKKARVNG